MTEIDQTSASIAMQAGTSPIWALLATVADPEIPVLSVLDLGVVRDVGVHRLACLPGNQGLAVTVTITPTYSSCPAMDLISMQIRMALLQAGYIQIDIKTVLSPAWTTDWMSHEGKAKLKQYGIAPPVGKSADEKSVEDTTVPCPRCGSLDTQLVSAFSSTACKAFYTCRSCQEPFDHFKCH
jgi:ring-1,2-phenylacetyl-CoA epoxidase subunit PaaD